jgi:hypothetical protein
LEERFQKGVAAILSLGAWKRDVPHCIRHGKKAICREMVYNRAVMEETLNESEKPYASQTSAKAGSNETAGR